MCTYAQLLTDSSADDTLLSVYNDYFSSSSTNHNTAVAAIVLAAVSVLALLILPCAWAECSLAHSPDTANHKSMQLTNPSVPVARRVSSSALSSTPRPLLRRCTTRAISAQHLCYAEQAVLFSAFAVRYLWPFCSHTPCVVIMLPPVCTHCQYNTQPMMVVALCGRSAARRDGEGCRKQLDRSSLPYQQPG